MKDRETFILKLVMIEGESGNQASAVLRSAKTGNNISFSSLEQLTEYLKAWENQSGKSEEPDITTDNGLQTTEN